MTDPWTVIGWIILVVFTLFGALAVYASLIPWASRVAYRRMMHRRTRNDAPAVGDLWIQGEANLHIDRIYQNGRIGIRCRNASWSDSPAEWRRRVRERCLYRERPAPKRKRKTS